MIKIICLEGWGVVDPLRPNHQSKTLRAVQVTAVSNKECAEKYAPIGVTGNMFCAATDGGDACYGDSGGPFTALTGRVHVLEGVISWGRNCAKARWPGVYSRVRSALDWVREESADSHFCPHDLPDVDEEEDKRDFNESDHLPIGPLGDVDGGWKFEGRRREMFSTEGAVDE